MHTHPSTGMMLRMDFPLVSALLVIAVFAAAAGSVIYHTFYNGISPMPTSPKVLKEMLGLIKSLNPAGDIVELGSGWGTVTFPLARQNPGCNVRAVENSPLPWLWTGIISRLCRCRNLTIRRGNLFDESLAGAEIVVCYLSPALMTRLRPKLEAELRNGSSIISNTFSVPGWRPFRVITAHDLYMSRVYLYRWPVAQIKVREFYG